LTHSAGLPFSSESEKKEGIKIIEDSSLSRGGCFLETSYGEIDATLIHQLEEVFSVVWKNFEKSGFHPESGNP